MESRRTLLWNLTQFTPDSFHFCLLDRDQQSIVAISAS